MKTKLFINVGNNKFTFAGQNSKEKSFLRKVTPKMYCVES